MPVKNYGVLKGIPLKSMQGSNKSPHYQVLVKDDQDISYRIAVNIKSDDYPSEVLYLVTENFEIDETSQLTPLKSGFTPLQNNPDHLGLDYIRGHFFDPAKMKPLPAERQGPNNDLNEKIQYYIKNAINEQATIYAFGAHWGPEKGNDDHYFGFTPGNGIHDIHMNQGNEGPWSRDNGIWQDGGLLIHFEEKKKWVGIFLAFQSQSWCTDENGDALKPVSQCNHLNVKSGARP